MFRKDTMMGGSTWYDPTRWEGDIRSNDNKQPIELVVTDLMEDVRGMEYSVRMRVKPDYQLHLDNQQCSYRMYLEFMGKGDLSALIKAHQAREEQIPEVRYCY